MLPSPISEPIDHQEARAAAETVARRSYGKLVAFLSAHTRDVAAAEDALADAFAAALREWPKTGCPQNPEAWLLTVARRKSIDAARRRQIGERAAAELQRTSIAQAVSGVSDEIPDRRLALMFACAHPSIDESVRAPLILQTILGLDAATIASAFLIAPAAMSKRLVRAKLKIREAGIPFRIPERSELPPRLDAVLSAIYATFGRGWSDATGSGAEDRDLTQEAIFLARVVVELLPAEAEAKGLLALMLYADSRRCARRSVTGEYIPLEEQNVGLWDSRQTAEAESLLSSARQSNSIGRYQIEAAVQSAHTHRLSTGHNNWAAVLQLYDVLFEMTKSPVVSINRALAVAHVHGTEAAINALPCPDGDPRLREYQPYWAARADLAARAGDFNQARHCYELAIGLECDSAVRRFLDGRRTRLPVDPAAEATRPQPRNSGW